MTEKDDKKKKKDETPEVSYPPMPLAMDIHNLSSGGDVQAILKQIADLNNPSLYRTVVKDHDPMECLSDSELKAMETANEETLEKLQKDIKEAEENAGDMEVLDGKVALAKFAAKSLTYDDAIQHYKQVLDLSKLSSGKKMDIYLELSQVCIFYNHDPQPYIAELVKMEGADWDRRNRLRVHQSIVNLQTRNFEAAAPVLLEGLATYNANVCTFQEYTVYTILTNLLFLDRPTLKKKIMDGPEILAIAKEIPIVMKLVQSFYDCEYQQYLHALVELETVLTHDRYLNIHKQYWLRELHILAYKQYLDSYQSVKLTAMAQAFGISVEFLDYHASRFIVSGELPAKIDKFGGVIVNSRPDVKNAKYREIIQKGDVLLNRIQTLARVVDL